MAHNHWPVGPEPQLCLTSLCYCWCQSNGGGCPTRRREWGYAYRYGSGAHAEYSTGTAVLDSRWDGNGTRRVLHYTHNRDGHHERYRGRGRRRRRPHMDEDRYKPRRTPVPQACITYLWRSRRCSRRSARPSRTPVSLEFGLAWLGAFDDNYLHYVLSK